MSIKSTLSGWQLRVLLLVKLLFRLIGFPLSVLYHWLSVQKVKVDSKVQASDTSLLAHQSHDRTIVLARTSMKVFTCEHTWTIEHFSHCDLHDPDVDSVRSAKFSAPSNDKVWFHCTVYPRGCREQSDGHVSWFLNYESREETVDKMAVGFKLSVMSGLGEKYLSMNSKFVFEGRKDNWGIYKLVSREELTNPANDLLPEDKLTLHCEVSYVTDYISTADFEANHSNSALDLGANLWKSSQFTDLVFTFSDCRKLAAHKAVLVTQSSFFRAMFKHDMQESVSNCVQIVDARAEVFGEMLRFIYTGKAKHLDTLATELLVLANKYQLDPLKSLCEQELCSRLNPSSAPNLYQLATTHNASQLKAQSFNDTLQSIGDLLLGQSVGQLLQTRESILSNLSKQRQDMAKENNESN